MGYTPEMKELIKRVEATRPEDMKSLVYVSATGKRIPNDGQKIIGFKVRSGKEPLHACQEQMVKLQVADARRPLISAGRVTEAGCDINPKHKKPHIHNPVTGEMVMLRKHSNVHGVVMRADAEKYGPVLPETAKGVPMKPFQRLRK